MPEHHQASDFEMSAKRRQKGKATESPVPSQEFTDEIEEDDRQEAGEETTSPTLGDLAKGHSELAGQVSALASQLELLVNAMASSTVAQTPAAQIKSAVVPPDPEDDEDFEDDSSESTDFELDGTSAAAHSADNPFPRQMRDAAGELVDLRNELTYQEFRRRNTLKGDPRRQEYRVTYTAASWLYDGLASLDQVLERRRADSQTLLEVERAFNSLKTGYDFIEDRLALIQLWVELH